MSVCVIFDATIPRHALLINFQLSAGIAILMGLKPNLYYKCFFFFFNIAKCYMNTNLYVYMENEFEVMPCFCSL